MQLGCGRAVPVRRGERNLSSHGAVPVPKETKRIKKFLGGLVPTRAGYLTEPHSPEPKRLLEPKATDNESVICPSKPVLDAFDWVFCGMVALCVFWACVSGAAGKEGALPTGKGKLANEDDGSERRGREKDT